MKKVFAVLFVLSCSLMVVAEESFDNQKLTLVCRSRSPRPQGSQTVAKLYRDSEGVSGTLVVYRKFLTHTYTEKFSVVGGGDGDASSTFRGIGLTFSIYPANPFPAATLATRHGVENLICQIH